MVALLQSLLRLLSAWCHGCLGTLCFRFGALRRARRRFERVLELRGDSFRAFVHLARIAYAEGDYVGWRREMEHARRCDPERFARLNHPFELFEPQTGNPFHEAGERATWRAMRSPGVRRGSIRTIELATERGDTAQAQRFGVDPEQGCGDLPRQAFGDDFLSETERLRFRQHGPITRADLAGLDLDEICRRLQA